MSLINDLSQINPFTCDVLFQPALTQINIKPAASSSTLNLKPREEEAGTRPVGSTSRHYGRQTQYSSISANTCSTPLLVDVPLKVLYSSQST